MYYCNECNIAYEEKNCPLCEAKEEIKSLNKEIERLNNLE
jgi:rubrerythrin